LSGTSRLRVRRKEVALDNEMIKVLVEKPPLKKSYDSAYETQNTSESNCGAEHLKM